jgi:hypothetical protein
MKLFFLLYLKLVSLNCFSLYAIKTKSSNSLTYKRRYANPVYLNENDNENENENENDTNSKSFYDFIKQKNFTLNIDENYVENYITKFVENYEKNQKENDTLNDTLNERQNETLTHKYLTTYNSYEKYIKAPLSKDLKMLTSESVIEWAKTWTYDMVHIPNQFPTFMFQDMFKMRDFANINSSQTYFYIGFFPKKVDLKHGPYFIGAFELVPIKREFLTHAIIQNPYYYNTDYDKTKIVEFKKELLALSRDASVFLKFSNLKNTDNERYYYSWLYDNI